MAEVRLTHLHPLELRDRREALAVAWLPIGTLEWHGLHLPLGFDGIKAEALCVRAAEEIGGVVFPASYYGDHRGVILEAIAAPGVWRQLTYDHRNKSCEELGISTAGVSANAVRDQSGSAGPQHIDLLERAYWMIRAYGFTRIVAVAGHYPNSLAARAAAERFHLKQSACRVICGSEGELGDGGGDHAGAYETSQLLHLDHGLVKLERLSGDDPDEPAGIGGEHPRAASIDRGAETVDAFIAGCRAELGDVPQPAQLQEPDEDGATADWAEQLAAKTRGQLNWVDLSSWLWGDQPR